MQSNAINSQLTLYVDEPLESDSFILHTGAYSFQSQIGNYGGYEVGVTKK